MYGRPYRKRTRIWTNMGDTWRPKTLRPPAPRQRQARGRCTEGQDTEIQPQLLSRPISQAPRGPVPGDLRSMPSDAMTLVIAMAFVRFKTKFPTPTTVARAFATVEHIHADIVYHRFCKRQWIQITYC